VNRVKKWRVGLLLAASTRLIMPVLFGFLLRIKSLNELNLMIKNHEFSKLAVKEDQTTNEFQLSIQGRKIW